MHSLQNKCSCGLCAHPMGLNLWYVRHWREPMTTITKIKVKVRWEVKWKVGRPSILPLNLSDWMTRFDFFTADWLTRLKIVYCTPDWLRRSLSAENLQYTLSGLRPSTFFATRPFGTSDIFDIPHTICPLQPIMNIFRSLVTAMHLYTKAGFREVSLYLFDSVLITSGSVLFSLWHQVLLESDCSY